MKSFATQIDIQAPPEQVWRVLVDLPNWTQWNTTVLRTVGSVERNAKVTVFVKLSPKRGFTVKVVELDAPRRMVWSSGMPFGLFKGTRVYELVSRNNQGTQFRMREEFTGPLSGLIGKSIPDMQPAFDEFAQCLKRELEKR